MPNVIEAALAELRGISRKFTPHYKAFRDAFRNARREAAEAMQEVEELRRAGGYVVEQPFDPRRPIRATVNGEHCWSDAYLREATKKVAAWLRKWRDRLRAEANRDPVSEPSLEATPFQWVQLHVFRAEDEPVVDGAAGRDAAWYAPPGTHLDAWTKTDDNEPRPHPGGNLPSSPLHDTLSRAKDLNVRPRARPLSAGGAKEEIVLTDREWNERQRHHPRTSGADGSPRWPLPQIAQHYPEQLGRLVEDMTERQERVFRLYFLDTNTEKDVAEIEGMSRSAVSEMLTRIRKDFAKAGLPEPAGPMEGQRALPQVEADGD